MIRMLLTITLLALAATAFAELAATEKPVIDVFYKNRNPSLMVLEKALPVLMGFSARYDIQLHCITSAEEAGLIAHYGLPETHFPFAVVVDGHYTARLDGRETHFVHFPMFLRGIGRHEGDWYVSDLERMLNGEGEWLDNALPVIEDDEEHGEGE